MANDTDTSQIQVFETSLRLKVEVNQEEKDRAAKDLADATMLHNQLIVERKVSNSDFTDRINQQRGVMSATAKVVKHGLREEEISANMEFDRNMNMVRYVRTDGEELTEGGDWLPVTDKQRALADAMRQEKLPGTGGEEDPEALAGGLETEE